MTTKEMLLTILMEECNETAQRASKSLRFGEDEIQEGQPLTNKERLIYEFNDVVAVMQLLFPHNQILLVNQMSLKRDKVKKYLAYSNECGTLTDPRPTPITEITISEMLQGFKDILKNTDEIGKGNPIIETICKAIIKKASS